MRADQLLRMREIQVKVAEAFFEEGDPKKWPGMDTKDDRGDRYWCKKNAGASLGLVMRIENLLALRDGRTSGGPTPAQETDDEANLEREVRETEKEAREIAKRVIAKYGHPVKSKG